MSEDQDSAAPPLPNPLVAHQSKNNKKGAIKALVGLYFTAATHAQACLGSMRP
jgi:hypothetical protein